MASVEFKNAIRAAEREIYGYVEIYDQEVDLKTGDTVIVEDEEWTQVLGTGIARIDIDNKGDACVFVEETNVDLFQTGNIIRITNNANIVVVEVIGVASTDTIVDAIRTNPVIPFVVGQNQIQSIQFPSLPTPSIKEQILDNVRIDGNYASLEPSFFSCEGMILPSTTDANNENIGYIGNTIGDANGTLTESLIVNLATTTNNIEGLTIYFKKGYPKNIKLTITNVSNVATVFNYTNDVEIFHHINSIENIKNVAIEISNWSVPYRRARIAELDFEISDLYEDGTLLDFQVVEQVSKLSLELPKNEVSVNLSNQDGRFDYINPTGIALYLQEGRTIKPYVGVLTTNGLEYESLGYFYLKEWKNNDNLTTTLTGLNLFEKLDKDINYDRYFEVESLSGYYPVGYLEFLLDSWGYPYNTVAWPSGFISTINAGSGVTLDIALPVMNRYQTLQQVAVCGADKPYNLYVDRDNIIQFKPIETISTDTIYLNNVMRKPTFNIRNKLKKVNIKISTAGGTGGFETENIFTTLIKINGTKDFFVVLDSRADIYDRFVNVSGGTLNSDMAYGEYLHRLNITATGNVEITISGRPLISSSVEYEYNYNTVGDELRIENGLFTDVNYYIGAFDDPNIPLYIDNLASVINANYDTYDIFFQWGQDPTIKAGQVITIETDYGFKDMFVEKQTIIYNGGLTGYTEGVGN